MKSMMMILVLAAWSCGTDKKTEEEPAYIKSSLLDSTASSELKTTDSLPETTSSSSDEDYVSRVYWDTVGVSTAPVKVLSAWFTRREYSNYKDIAVRYKNVSDKKISAIRFKWYGITAFNDPADMGTSLKEGFGGGFSETPLRPGATNTSEWSILSRNGKKVVMAWPTEIAFEDGSSWKSSYK